MIDDIDEIFNKEIVRELLLGVNPDTDDQLVDEMWVMCKGNPWDAAILYEMIRLFEKSTLNDTLNI